MRGVWGGSPPALQRFGFSATAGGWVRGWFLGLIFQSPPRLNRAAGWRTR